jgi:ABC-type glycerol-3-phosphate transport system permease component
MAEAIRPVESSRPGERGLILWLTQQNRAYYLVGYLLLLALALWTLFPVYWQLATSLRADVDLFSPTVTLVPRVLTGEHYEKILGPSYPFLRQLRNSAVVAVATTVVSTLLGAMAGYALTRLRFAGRTVLARLLVYAYLAPGTILFIPLFVMMSRLGLRDNLVGLTLAYLTFTVPFATWMLMGYFRTVPIELEEAALIDGASRWRSSGASWFPCPVLRSSSLRSSPLRSPGTSSSMRWSCCRNSKS